MSSKRASLSDKFANLINPAPLQDPEDDDIQEETAAKVVDFDEDSDDGDEPAVSKLRQQNAEFIGLADGRYAGEKVSRKALDANSEEEEESDEESGDASDIVDNGSSEEKEMNQAEMNSASDDEGDSDYEESSINTKDDDEDSAGSSEEGGDEEDDDGNIFPDNDQDEQQSKANDFQHFSNTDKATEVQKGSAVRNQLNIWDGILEFRIQLQKCLIASNQLPSCEKIDTFKSQGGKELSSAQTYCTKRASSLLDKLMQLQSELLKQNPETKNILSSKKSSMPVSKDPGDEEITSSEDEKESEEEDESEKNQQPTKKRKLEDYSSEISKIQAKFVGFRNTTIQKWNDKTRVAQGKLSSKNFSAFEQSTLKQIEQVMTDKQRLLKRTRMKRSGYRILGEQEKSEEKNKEESEESKIQEFCPEIFDDDDFYHQLLRELIEHKSEGVTDPVQLGRQWIALQKLRSKMKRKIDTRATKGRKIRYTVHPKLVNFMAPYDKCSWSEESKAELFNSLFAV